MIKKRIKQIVRPLYDGICRLLTNVFGADISKGYQYVHFKRKAAFFPTFGESEIISWLREQGIESGDTLFLHSSWDHFVNFNGSPKSLIDALVDFIGPEGTLLMPAFPAVQDPTQVFKVRRTPSGAGFLTEIFRRYPGVKRSINLNHSVCALGPQAEFLINTHHLSETSWDQNSPYYRLREIDNSWIVGMGVGHDLKVATSLHCVDSMLKDDLPFFNQLFSNPVTYTYEDAEKQTGTHTFYPRIGGKLNTKKVARKMGEQLREGYVSNLDAYVIPARHLIDHAIELGKNGVTMYRWPIPYQWKFKK
ncbi:AAC(3) family N-acetyltransferase, partial [bacterium]|nr:AAC(3) family N-acetyltransferase [bacterium]